MANTLTPPAKAAGPVPGDGPAAVHTWEKRDVTIDGAAHEMKKFFVFCRGARIKYFFSLIQTDHRQWKGWP